MADPPAERQETTASFAEGDLEIRTTSENRKRTCSGDVFAPSDPAGRITTKEVWKLISTLKDTIHQQTTTIAATQSELQEIRHSQHVLQERTRNCTKNLRHYAHRLKQSHRRRQLGPGPL